MTTYSEFLQSKQQTDTDGGFEPTFMPDVMFDFQKHLTDWALRRGRAALFEDCGTGKTLQELVWAQNVVEHTNKPVMVLTPLAVSSQTVREGEKFGIECKRTNVGEVHPGINVSNFERLHYYTATDFGGVVCDESGILKNFDGETRKAITEFMRVIPYRLLCTATAAPNDYFELGTSSEALGYLGFMDMLGKFFKNDRNTSSTGRAWSGHGGGAPAWRFRGHAEKPFWRWVASWARTMRKPSDLGFDDGDFELPELIENEHTVRAKQPRDGYLFSIPAVGLAEEREERRRTIHERCEIAASLVNDTGKPAIAWCQLNDEGDLLEKLIPDAVQVSGKDSDDQKEEKFTAFTLGQVRVLVTKPIIGAWGMNWQHCAHMTTFATHSFEQYYQSVRRLWRYGQREKVVVDHVLSDGEGRVLRNLQRKAEATSRLFEEINRSVLNELQIDSNRSFTETEAMPSWL